MLLRKSIGIFRGSLPKSKTSPVFVIRTQKSSFSSHASFFHAAEAKQSRIYVPNKATIIDNKLIFDTEKGFDRALSEGFFFIKTPSIDMSFAKKLALNFYKNKSANADPMNIYKGYNGVPNNQFMSDMFQNGYIDRENNQSESLYLMPEHVKTFPNSLNNITNVMNRYSVTVLKNVLEKLNIPMDIWLQATGGCLESDNYLVGFNHYRPEKDKPGTVVHKDSGWVTILYSEQPGLRARIGDEWVPIDPIPEYFTVNFGCLLDVLTKNCKTPAVASLHKVDRQYKSIESDRFSVGLYLQPKMDNTKVYTYEPKNKELNYLQSYKDFVAELIKLYDSEVEDEKNFTSDALAARRGPS